MSTIWFAARSSSSPLIGSALLSRWYSKLLLASMVCIPGRLLFFSAISGLTLGLIQLLLCFSAPSHLGDRFPVGFAVTSNLSCAVILPDRAQSTDTELWASRIGYVFPGGYEVGYEVAENCGIGVRRGIPSNRS